MYKVIVTEVCSTFFVAKNRRNVPTKVKRMWNTSDAMRGHSAAWKSILTAIIQNRLAKCGCRTARPYGLPPHFWQGS